MGFNYGLEKRKFTEEWKKLYREYKAAGRVKRIFRISMRST